jgi:uncharacterized protein
MSQPIVPPEPFVLQTPEGRSLHGLVDRPDRDQPNATVVFCHGFKGFMEWGSFPHVAELLASRGFTVVRFNFSGSGMEPGEDRVTDPEGFRRNTFSREQEDLGAVLEALGDRIAPGRVDRRRIGLLGHSRGGGAAILAAGSERWRAHVRALVTWASVGTFERFDDQHLARWRETGEWVVTNARTGQELPIAVDVLDDYEANRNDLDVRAAAGRVEAPWLIVHGEEDETVPVAEARELLADAGGADPGRRELLEIPGASHTWNAAHPFQCPTPQLIAALNATQTWFRRHLGS